MAYEIGPVYIWQNQVGAYAFYNGTECRVVGPRQPFLSVLSGGVEEAWPTDAAPPSGRSYSVFAGPGDLRRRDPPPSGERLVLELFREWEHA
jgi:hypothetical protein